MLARMVCMFASPTQLNDSKDRESRSQDTVRLTTDVEGGLVATERLRDAEVVDETPFRILLIGDWSGRANRQMFASSEELAGWRPLTVDRDNLDQLMERLGVTLVLPVAKESSETIKVSFNCLDDFHPDRLFRRLEIFEDLRRLRTKLINPLTFAEAVREIRESPNPPATSYPAAPTTPAVARESSTKSVAAPGLLDQILEGDSAEAASEISPDTSPQISEFVRAIVQPHLMPNIEPDQERLIGSVDNKTTESLRALLHHPDFQALEASWRALDLLVTRLDTSSQLEVSLLDISWEEFKADLNVNSDLRDSAIHKLLVEETVETPGATPWAVIAANYMFDLTELDSAVVERLALIAQEAGAPLIGGSTAHLLGCESLVETPDPDDWNQSKQDVPESLAGMGKTLSASYLGFALPRFLLRLPYGKETDPCEELDFEELAQDEGKLRHDSFLWANPSFAVAYVLAKAFASAGSDKRPGDFQNIEGLPLYVNKREGESEILPCAEVLLTVRAAQRIIDMGLIPLLSMKDTDTIRVGLIQSIAGTHLAGRWDSGLKVY